MCGELAVTGCAVRPVLVAAGLLGAIPMLAISTKRIQNDVEDRQLMLKNSGKGVRVH